jgi:peptide-methionine (S)-S-oxide reductase
LSKETAVLGSGCFWCTEAIFQELRGVISVEPGYSGGITENPSYEQVCTGKTGHAEVTKIIFENTEVEYNEILDVFFSIHDPTSLNKQGADVGIQYRSVIFYTDELQMKKANDMIITLRKSGEYKKDIVTEVVPFKIFYPAEDYHKNYYRNNKSQPYCQLVISPKLKKLKKYQPEKIKL